MLATFHIPSTVIVGAGASAELANQIRRLGAKRVLLVTDHFLEQTGLVGKLTELLQEADLSAAVYNGVQPDPTVQNVLDGLRQFRASEAEVIVAIGGGSP